MDGQIAVDHSQCRRVAPILQKVGDKWSILIVMTLAGGTRRFSELKRAIDGISQRMLTLTLRGLERDGLVKREVFPTIPPRVDYALTDLGRSLRVPVIALGQWVQANLDEIDSAREAFDKAEQETREASPLWPASATAPPPAPQEPLHARP
ncbi:MAG: helix-turn-helix transcriptional regulator [Sphingobium sp.]|nr:helix-turn-helix transcriptional regulator [Sphingobium sp.]